MPGEPAGDGLEDGCGHVQAGTMGHGEFLGKRSGFFGVRLPEGNNRDDVEGFDSTDYLTLEKLQAGSIPSLPTVDGSTTYTEWSDLVDTLPSIIAGERGGGAPHPWVNTSDPDRRLNLATIGTTTRLPMPLRPSLRPLV